MSRRAVRIRAQLAATVHPVAGDLFVCQTRDVSSVGCFLDTAAPLDLGAQLSITIFDRTRGAPIEVTGAVTRVLGNDRKSRMQLIIMDSRLTRCRTLQLTGGRLVAAALAASLVLMCVAALLYHLVFLKGARKAGSGIRRPSAGRRC